MYCLLLMLLWSLNLCVLHQQENRPQQPNSHPPVTPRQPSSAPHHPPTGPARAAGRDFGLGPPGNGPAQYSSRPASAARCVFISFFLRLGYYAPSDLTLSGSIYTIWTLSSGVGMQQPVHTSFCQQQLACLLTVSLVTRTAHALFLTRLQPGNWHKPQSMF